MLEYREKESKPANNSWPMVMVALLVIFIFVVSVMIFTAPGKDNGYKACSNGWGTVCIDAPQKSDFKEQDGCVEYGNDKICGPYTILRKNNE